MKILLTGVETNNKGAELMLYAILQEIERNWPGADVYISKHMVFCGIENIRTNLKIKLVPGEWLEDILHIGGIFRLLKIPYHLTPHKILMGKIDYLLDGSGFAFSDQFDLTHETAMYYEHRLKAYKKQGTKIIYLPQAFGPFNREGSKEVLSVLGHYASILMPREGTSSSYIKDTNLVDMSKVKIYTDFTSLVSGEFPNEYSHLKDGICIIPNRQMINKGAIKFDDYIYFLKTVLIKGKDSGHVTYLLNHEGKKDEELCEKLKSEIDDIEIVTGLDALKVKGIISTSYLVISSRFHGVASSLNSCVPCLATSWSHKYEELFNDYGLQNCILPLDSIETALNMIDENLQRNKNNDIRLKLIENLPKIKKQTCEMWRTVWGNK